MEFHVLQNVEGFLYLTEELEGEDGKHYPMVGALPGKGIKKGRLTRFGYIELTAEMKRSVYEKGGEDPGA